jgi:hypothetical protein
LREALQPGTIQSFQIKSRHVDSARQLEAPATLDAQQVTATIKQVADWQLVNPVPYDPQHWAMAPLYDGLIDTSLTTGDPQYLASVIRAGRQIAWQPGPRVYHADDNADDALKERDPPARLSLRRGDRRDDGEDTVHQRVSAEERRQHNERKSGIDECQYPTFSEPVW